MRSVIADTFLIVMCLASLLQAQEYTVEVITDSAPAAELSADIAAQLASSGYRVVQDGKRAVWEFWPAKKWSVEAGAELSAARLYPLEPGALLGVVVLARRSTDFRDQTLSRGVFTLRYALQPIDGNHVGTSPTRDFLLLVRAEDDVSPQPTETEALIQASAKAAGSSHPAMMCLQKLTDDATAPAIRLLEPAQWWVLRLANPAGDAGEPLSLDLVIVGHAAE